MQLAAGSAGAQAVGARLGEARAAFEAVVNHLLSKAKDAPNAAYGGSVPYLMLAGNLVSGWQLAKSLLVAEAQLSADIDAEFMAGKIASARFYAEHVLCDVEAQRRRILEGADSLSSVVL